jgi:hypothetical protein
MSNEGKINPGGVDIEERTDYATSVLASNPIRSAKYEEFSVRHLRESLLAIVVTGASVGLIGCEEEIRTDPEPILQAEESRSVEESPSAEARASTGENTQGVNQSHPAMELDSSPGPVADNSRCYVCHVNFKDEVLTKVHAQAAIGCTRCHGDSDGHRSDEDNITPPDVMFPKVKIKSFCTSCHDKNTLSIPAHKSVIAEMDPLKACCTECHGEHRLNYRTRKWDKTTRNLIKDERVLRLSDEMLERR